MTRRLHITALTGNGMTTEYRALATPHMGSAPWVPETVQAAARVLLEADEASQINLPLSAYNALATLAEEDEDDR